MIVDIEYATIRWIENNIMLPDMAQKISSQILQIVTITLSWIRFKQLKLYVQ